MFKLTQESFLFDVGCERFTFSRFTVFSTFLNSKILKTFSMFDVFSLQEKKK